jgi:hypothetical protein
VIGQPDKTSPAAHSAAMANIFMNILRTILQCDNRAANSSASWQKNRVKKCVVGGLFGSCAVKPQNYRPFWTQKCDIWTRLRHCLWNDAKAPPSIEDSHASISKG